MPDYIILEKEAVEKLSFLNGQIGEREKIKEFLEKEIDELNESHKNKIESFDRVEETKRGHIILLETTIASRQKESDELFTSVVLGNERLSTITESTKEKEKTISAKEKSIANREIELEEKERNIQKTKSTIDLRLKEIDKDVIDLENRKNSLKLKEENFNTQFEALESKEKSILNREKKLKSSEEENSKVVQVNAARSNEIDKQNEVLSIEKRKFEVEKIDFLKSKENFKTIIDDLENRKNSISELERTTKTKNDASIIREEKSILKEEELKIREKRISLKEQGLLV